MTGVYKFSDLFSPSIISFYGTSRIGPDGSRKGEKRFSASGSNRKGRSHGKKEGFMWLTWPSSREIDIKLAPKSNQKANIGRSFVWTRRGPDRPLGRRLKMESGPIPLILHMSKNLFSFRSFLASSFFSTTRIETDGSRTADGIR